MLVTVEAAHHGEPGSPPPDVSKWVDNVLGSSYHGYRSGDTWSPAVDVYESRNYFYVVADLAGVQTSSIGILAKGRGLTITGLRPTPELPGQGGKVRMHMMEIDQGPFKRTIEVPGEADVTNFEATFRFGFLWIRIPRRS